jgi:hypothetical protein
MFPQLILPDLITLITLEGEYNLRSTSLCVPNFLLPVTSFSLGLPQFPLLSVVGVATGYWLDDRSRTSSPGRVKSFLFSTSSRPALGPAQPPI